MGELRELGPFCFINTIANPSANFPKPSIVVRANFRAGETEPPKLQSNDDFEHYHGGDWVDEIAALVSIFLGIRVMGGHVEREFRPDGDPLGRPIQYMEKKLPHIMPASGWRQIPNLFTDRNLCDLSVLSEFPNKSVAETNALTKAARLYQRAVWTCDAEPELAWLLLVSSVETIAVLWANDKDEPSKRLEVALPELYSLLADSSCPGLVEPVAKILRNITRSTKKFVDFLVEFAPPPPLPRPQDWEAFSFSQKDIRGAASIIYGHRSSYLHSGVAFPLPMCRAPQQVTLPNDQVGTAFQEVPFGLAMGAKGAVWQKAATPMILHTFEHLARNSIINWWRSLT